MKKNRQLDKLIDQVIISSFSKGRLDNKKVFSFVDKFKKMSKGDAIYSMVKYVDGLKREMSKTTLEIESATALSQMQIKTLTNALKADHQINNVVIRVNPALMGGVRVKIGDSVFEDTILSRIEQMKEVVSG